MTRTFLHQCPRWIQEAFFISILLAISSECSLAQETDKRWDDLFVHEIREGNTDSAYLVFRDFLISNRTAWDGTKNWRILREMVFSVSHIDWRNGSSGLSDEERSVLFLRYQMVTELMVSNDHIRPNVFYSAVSSLILQNEYQEYVLSRRNSPLISDYLQTLVGLFVRESMRLDTDFNEKKMPLLNLTVPGHPEYPAGVPPDSVSDAKAREAYVERLAANRSYNDHYRNQMDLRRILPRLSDDIRRAVGNIARHSDGREQVDRLRQILESVPGMPKGVVTEQSLH